MEIIDKFRSALEGATNIVLTTHSFPDADGIGSEIALCLALRELGKNAICCNDVPLLNRYKYLDPQEVITDVENIGSKFSEAPDLIIVVDTNTIKRTGPLFNEYYNQINCPVLYIDHHPCAESTKEDHCIDTTAAATGQLVGNLILKMGLKFNKEMALPLYTAVLIDTSSFRYPTVTAQTHKMIAMFMETGINPPAAYNGIYGTKKVEHMHLLGSVLATTKTNASEEIAWLVLKHQEINHFDIDIEDTHGFINNLLILDEIKVACMFRDDGDQVKISFRSAAGYDVGGIAIALGGGGHAHSAATIIKKSESKGLYEIIDDVIQQIEAILA
ncbi:MAG: hypothetical protein CME62_01950 [Halobacteriovoraceae bacterium]|nr:hypothetical protein [Halobacteriovoraceae bacterium]|tara:strand:+ start:25572 stop:26561 length:990 start_codon:yes stop_codon:yes gene_type:complete